MKINISSHHSVIKKSDLKDLLKIMKISLLFFFAIVFQLSAVNSNAQDASIKLKSTTITIGELIREIENQTDYLVVYSNREINTSEEINLLEKSNKVSEYLKEAFSNLNIGYDFENNYIVLSKRSSDQKLLETVINSRNQQPGKTITGTILDIYGEPIIGATIVVQGEVSKGTVSDTDGKFTIQNLSDDVILNISFVGMLSKSISIDGRSSITVTLTEDTELLDELVVIGYGSKNKSKIIGSVNQVSSETFKDKAVTNISQALQGAIPNLNISFSDGQINRNASINIRGMNSINGGSPLILIDGVPGSINLISPEDIETISVLKDASSAAIYGAQASYGVILVTTKKGSSEKPKFRYTSSFGYGQPLKTPKILTDGLQYTEILQEAYVGWTGSELSALNQVQEYLTAYNEDPTLPISFVDNMYFSFISGRMTDWYKMIFNDKQPFSRHFGEVSGKSDKINYYISAGIVNQDGAYREATDHLRKYSMRTKLDVKLSNSLSIFNNFSIEDQNYNSPITNVTGSNNILRFISQLGAPFSSPYDNEGNYSYGGMVSLGVLKDGGRTIQRTNTVRNTFGGEFLITNNLSLKGDYSIWWDRSRGDDQKFRLSYASRPGRVAPLSAMTDYYASAYSQGMMQTINLYANYDKTFGNHTLGGVVGFNQSSNDYNLFSGRITENMFPNYGSLNLGEGIQTVSDNAYDWGTRGYFYRVSYDYLSKYLVELNGRYDGTSRFPSQRRWGFFPSAAVGWMISEEPFMAFTKPLLNIFKIRASYGSLGNQQVDTYSYFSTMSKSQMSYISEGERLYAMSVPGLVAGDLTWETVVSKNIGFDMGFFRNKLNFGFDVYERETRNMLVAGVSLPATLGASVPRTNSADLSVKGWEASMTWQDNFKIFDKNGRYSVSFVMSDNKAVITRFSGNDGQLLSGYNVGEEIGTIWGLSTLGYFESDEDAMGWADQTEVSMLPNDLSAGDIKFADLNNDGKITKGKQTLYDHGDLTRIGNSSIRYPFSIDFSANWSSFDLNLYLQGVGQRDFYPGPESSFFWGFYNRYYNPVMEHHVDNYWTPENTNAYFPRPRAYIAQKSNYELGAIQTKYLQDASYLRLKTLTFGYTLPQKLTNHVWINKFRIFFTGQNLLTFTRLHESFDPEGIANINSNGAGLVYPTQKTFTLGVDINF
ncbi:TonB-dependent receptor [Dysgonomonadaceae bacterium zrk40]|nr:TonB-dependent receptor [Dysgonomonadaceae bacterium zrk40]